jgi:hypothetical protein
MGSALVREAVEAWLAYLSTERRLATKTSEAYERDIGQFLTFLARHFNRLPDMNRLLALSARDVRAFLAARRGGGRWQPEPRPDTLGASHVLQISGTAGLRQERRDPRRGASQVAPFGAEADHRAEGDRAG